MSAGSAYIRWAKSRERFRYNLGRSSIQACPAELLGRCDVPLHGPNADGWLPLRELLAERYDVDCEQIVLAVGASMANHLACAALLSPGDHVIVETPGYEPLTALVARLGCRIDRFERRAAARWRVESEAARAGVRTDTRLIIVSDLHNPSGQQAGADALVELAEAGERGGFHVLVDEVYREFVHGEGRPIAARLHPRLISTCSLTKAYGLDGLRAGWIVASPDLARRMRDLNDLFGIIMPYPTEWLAWRALQALDSIRAWVDAFVAPNRRALAAFVDARPELEWVAPEHGTIGFARLRGIDVDALVARLEDRFDTTAPAGRHFGAPGHLRLAAGMCPRDLNDGLERFAAALDDMAGPYREGE